MDKLYVYFYNQWLMLLDWPKGTLLAGAYILIELLIVSYLLWFILDLFDKKLGHEAIRMGKVIKKTFTPAHTEFTLMIFPIPSYVSKRLPSHYSLTVELEGGGTTSMEVHPEFYTQVTEGMELKVEYRVSGVWRKIHPHHISHPKY